MSCWLCELLLGNKMKNRNHFFLLILKFLLFFILRLLLLTFFWHKSLFSTKKVTKYYKNVFNTNFYVVWLKIDDINEYCIKLSMKMTQMNFIYFVPSKFARVSCCHYSNDYHVVVNFLLLSCGIVYIFHCHEKRHLLTKLFVCVNNGN